MTATVVNIKQVIIIKTPDKIVSFTIFCLFCNNRFKLNFRIERKKDAKLAIKLQSKEWFVKYD